MSLVLVALLGTGAYAAEPLKVGIVDQQAVLEKTKVGRRVLEELKAFSGARQKLISADDEELKKLESELNNPESSLSEAARRQKQETFRTKLEAYQRRVQDFNREIQIKQKEYADDFQKKFEEVVAAVAKREGYAALLDKGSEATFRVVLYAREGIDLTNEVIKEFDKRYK
jgi:outer membrane protein